ncbi:hypothetical protein Nepgr_026311 [Nepenthes gracilis]|uniref:Uncharacterized protein n=1 Tax=Nepenthes gracilis TaxID=150966 RepID=A0AAD3T6M4_NEPGR|nr:hypothetical protein Nepgr_026311 [Nepenthes gracilis]
MDFEKKIGDEEGIVKVDGQSGKLYSESRKRRRIGTEDQTPPDDNLNTHMERRKSTRFPRSAAAAKKRVLNSEEDGGALKQQNSLPWKPKQSSNPEVENGAVAGEGTVKISHPRERRKSKYLSPPYTNPEQQKERERSRRGSQEAAALESSCTSSAEQRQRESSKKRSEAAAMEFSDVARMQQSMEKAAGPHIGSVGKRDPRTNVDRTLESMTSPSEILTEIPSSDLDTIKGFISSYRNSKYQNESNDHLPGKNKADRAQWKRNSSVPFCGSEAQDPKPRCRMDKKDEEEKLGLNRDSEVGEGKNSPALLLLTFPPRFSLPSKNDLTKIYRKFGALDETKTEVLQKSSTAKIFFAKSSDAEAAMSSSQQSSPFGVAKVSYTVQGFITMPEINKANENTCPKASSKFRKKSRYSANQSGLGSSEIKQNNKESGSVATGGGASELAFLREKLEAMASILGENDGAMSLEIKSNLEREMKELLGKVRRMTASSSSVAS